MKMRPGRWHIENLASFLLVKIAHLEFQDYLLQAPHRDTRVVFAADFKLDTPKRNPMAFRLSYQA
jgi:hypothetical protein